MKNKKGSIKKQRSQSAVEIAHRTAILVEGLRSDFKFVIEKVDGMEERLVRRMDGKFAIQDERFDRIEAILKMHSQMLNQNEERWKQNELRWGLNEERWKQNEARWEQNDVRLQRMEGKLDCVVEKVGRHDRELKEIRAATGL